MPLTRADVARRNEDKRASKLAYAGRTKHLRRLSPDRISKLSFHPPLRRYDTDELAVTSTKAEPILAYVAVVTDQAIAYNPNPAAGVKHTISAPGTPADETISLPGLDQFHSMELTLRGNITAKTGINLLCTAFTGMAQTKAYAKPLFIEQPVALRAVCRGGLSKVTYVELGHSPPGVVA